MLHNARVFSNDEVIACLLMVRIWTMYVARHFPTKVMSEIWKYELGWFHSDRLRIYDGLTLEIHC